jgi:hypothetical protein
VLKSSHDGLLKNQNYISTMMEQIFFVVKQQTTIQHGLMLSKHAIDATTNFVELMFKGSME